MKRLSVAKAIANVDGRYIHDLYAQVGNTKLDLITIMDFERYLIHFFTDRFNQSGLVSINGFGMYNGDVGVKLNLHYRKLVFNVYGLLGNDPNKLHLVVDLCGMVGGGRVSYTNHYDGKDGILHLIDAELTGQDSRVCLYKLLCDLEILSKSGRPVRNLFVTD